MSMDVSLLNRSEGWLDQSVGTNRKRSAVQSSTQKDLMDEKDNIVEIIAVSIVHGFRQAFNKAATPLKEQFNARHVFMKRYNLDFSSEEGVRQIRELVQNHPTPDATLLGSVPVFKHILDEIAPEQPEGASPKGRLKERVYVSSDPIFFNPLINIFGSAIETRVRALAAMRERDELTFRASWFPISPPDAHSSKSSWNPTSTASGIGARILKLELFFNDDADASASASTQASSSAASSSVEENEVDIERRRLSEVQVQRQETQRKTVNGFKIVGLILACGFIALVARRLISNFRR